MKDYFELTPLLIQRNITIATAESCTGGLIAKMISDVPGASAVFVGGLVPYSNKMKSDWLGVSEDTLEKYGAVSAETVSQMLDGLIKQSGADIGIAVSGIAGPSGGVKEKPVGTVFIGVVKDKKKNIKKYFFSGSRDEVREKSARAALVLIEQALDF